MLPGIPATRISPDRLMRNTVSRAWYIIRSRPRPAQMLRDTGGPSSGRMRTTTTHDGHPPAPHGQVDRTSRSPTPHTDGKPLNTP
ncbi:hypothetical protein FB570_12337 [Streptomyces sp. T12]|nr:hypothetical protein FB570_12337 [Streptomyces sp. T12]